jgi:hypothetical protein
MNKQLFDLVRKNHRLSPLDRACLEQAIRIQERSRALRCAVPFTKTAAVTFTNTPLTPAYHPELAVCIDGLLVPNVSYPKGTILGEQTGVSEVQTVTLGGTPTAGTFTITFQGQTTAGIAYNATGAAVQAALQALSNIGTGNVTVAGAAGGPYTLTFAGALGNQDVPQVTASNAGLTPPTATVTPATTTPGRSLGNYAFCATGNVDGSQVPKGLLVYDTTTDANGNVTWGQQPSGNEFLATGQNAVPIYVDGYFRFEDMPTGTYAPTVGVLTLFARTIHGSFAAGGVFRIQKGAGVT